MHGRWFECIDEQRAYCLTFICLFLLQLCPVWFTPYPAMHDYPNHFARAVIIHEYSSNEMYQATYAYEPNWWLIPNLASDLIVPALIHMAGVETASRLFLSLIILVFNMGVHLLGVAIYARPHWHAPVSTLFLYNFFWPMGLPNYLLGLGLFFVTLALWLRFRSAWTMGRVFMITILAGVCYVTHLSAFVFLGVSIACLAGLDLLKAKKLGIQQIIGFLPLVPPTLIYLWYSSGILEKAPMEWWQPVLVKKVMGLLYPFLTYDLIIDGGLGLSFVVLMLFALKVTANPLVSRELFFVGGILFVLYAVAPMSGGVQSTYVDRRIVVPAIVLMLLALRIDLSKRVGRYLLIGLLCVCVVRVAEVWYYWDRIGEEVQEQVQMLKQLPEGARLYPMFVHDPSLTGSWLWDMHFFNTAHYATIYRHAFVPTLWAARGAFLIHRRSSDTGYVQIERNITVDQVKWDVIFSKYDYLLGYKLSEPLKEFLLSKGDFVAEKGVTMLFRMRKE
ncbi:Conserved membrane protein of unknown function [Nitrospira sp. KM1]|uniref:hypothetical protein n=1 Tax=Nitrospira sp. KM1 TaxID=1936990 RepID=UPI0013A77229|nr:hypothetical protein [Nitrospira sp. KM1]BCA54084.1 Conserved membrane protein of unknown function [Nitrospira sp. KM1]